MASTNIKSKLECYTCYYIKGLQNELLEFIKWNVIGEESLHAQLKLMYNIKKNIFIKSILQLKANTKYSIRAQNNIHLFVVIELKTH